MGNGNGDMNGSQTDRNTLFRRIGVCCIVLQALSVVNFVIFRAFMPEILSTGQVAANSFVCAALSFVVLVILLVASGAFTSFIWSFGILCTFGATSIGYVQIVVGVNPVVAHVTLLGVAVVGLLLSYWSHRRELRN